MPLPQESLSAKLPSPSVNDVVNEQPLAKLILSNELTVTNDVHWFALSHLFHLFLFRYSSGRIYLVFIFLFSEMRQALVLFSLSVCGWADIV